MPESLSTTPADETNRRVDVVLERVSNLQTTVEKTTDGINARFDKWEERSTALEQFQNKVLGGVQATAFTVRILGWSLGALQAIALIWIGSVNLTVHNSEERLTKVETRNDFIEKANAEHNAIIDGRLNGIDRKDAGYDTDIESLKLGQDRLDRTRKQ
jgi:hypothetical protein